MNFSKTLTEFSSSRSGRIKSLAFRLLDHILGFALIDSRIDTRKYELFELISSKQFQVKSFMILIIF